jgi:hypothetical protein
MTTKEITDAALKKRPFLFRNNRGVAKIKNSFIRFGIPEPSGRETESSLKGGDLIGFEEIEITPDMVGRKIAVFTSVEVKGPGDSIKLGQKLWHNFILEHGGVSEIWRDKKDEIEIIKGGLYGE